MTKNNDVGTFGDHLEELRYTLIRVILAVALGFCVSLLFHRPIFEFLTNPLTVKNQISTPNGTLQRQTLKRERIVNPHGHIVNYIQNNTVYAIPPMDYVDIDIPQTSDKLLILSPTEGITTIIKVCLWTGFLISSPIWLFFIAQFISPALYQQEKNLLFTFIFYSLLFLMLGTSFAFFVTIPIANQYLYAVNSSIGENFWSLGQYLDYTVFLLIANALAFESCVIILFLIKLNFLMASTMVQYRRHAIVLAFILGAILTPPDILTQVMLAIPLIVLYELMILYAKLREKRKNQEPVQI